MNTKPAQRAPDFILLQPGSDFRRGAQLIAHHDEKFADQRLNSHFEIGNLIVIVLILRGSIVTWLLGMACAVSFFVCVHVDGDDEGDLCALASRSGEGEWKRGVEDGG